MPCPSRGSSRATGQIIAEIQTDETPFQNQTRPEFRGLVSQASPTSNTIAQKKKTPPIARRGFFRVLGTAFWRPFQSIS